MCRVFQSAVFKHDTKTKVCLIFVKVFVHSVWNIYFETRRKNKRVLCLQNLSCAYVECFKYQAQQMLRWRFALLCTTEPTLTLDLYLCSADNQITTLEDISVLCVPLLISYYYDGSSSIYSWMDNILHFSSNTEETIA